MQKVQCLALARNALQDLFVNSMQHFQENQMYRVRFTDQLQVNYREWLLRKVDEEQQKEGKSGNFVTTALIAGEVEQLQTGKDAIKKTHELKLLRKEKIRRIESNSQRTVHFIFDTGIPQKITPFTRKYKRLIQG